MTYFKYHHLCIDIESIGVFFLFIYISLVGVTRLVYRSQLFLLAATVSLIVCGIVGFYLQLLDKCFAPFMYSILMFISWAFIYIARSEWHYDVSDIIESLCYIGGAYLLIRHDYNERVFSFLYYFFSAFVLYELGIRGVSIRGFMKDGTSYNYISILILFYLTILNIVRIKNRHDIKMSDLAILLVISIVSYGRGGILTAMIYLGLEIIYRMYRNKINYKSITIVSMTILLSLLGGERILSSIERQGYFAKFSRYGFETQRTQLWSNYLHTLFHDGVSFLTGGRPDLVFAEGNLHNWVLQLMAVFGPVFWGITLYLFIKAVAGFLKMRRFELLVLIIPFLVRAFTDKLMFRNYYELFFYYCLFLKNRNVAAETNR